MLNFNDDETLVEPQLIHEIEPNLFMGGTPATLGECPTEYEFIVCLYPWETYKIYDHQVLLQAKLYDGHLIPEPQLLIALADYVNAVRKIGPALVHCQQGWNRSGLVTALALIRNGMPPKDAIALLREKRSPYVLCNPVFEGWLLSQ